MAVPATLQEMGCGEHIDPCDVSDDGAPPAPSASGLQAAWWRDGSPGAASIRGMSRPRWVGTFSKPATNPLEFAPGSTSMLALPRSLAASPSRTLYAALDAAIASQSQHTEPPQSLHGQLYWREFFYLVAHATPNFGSASGNPLCLHVPWKARSGGRRSRCGRPQAMGRRHDWRAARRRCDAAAQGGRVAAPPAAARGGVLPDARPALGALGGRPRYL